MTYDEFETMQRAKGFAPHWVIINEERSAIWKNPFLVEEVAKEEIKRQAELAGGFNGWKIEQKWHKQARNNDSVYDSL